ncbi:hypothetical protein Q1W73_09400 [Asticcacaulis sp. ZE23SCel15]|uniref:hypothetical protein n=1 Tax=Asticcacaulis sp. ZE23SCel15 TaxID=3059027 RepID=UPI00265F4322|nr:hypothetical protein [Asticcacaulis sp. ZE23SCel15]WKL55919.1 hypothetical protein Q1W73_09400 [Asticcacaulis sp. ZE23SCel15]
MKNFKSPILAITIILFVIYIVFVFTQRQGMPVSGVVNLSKGAVQTVKFKADYNANYYIGIEMEYPIAKKLFPCTVDTESKCSEPLPVNIYLTLLADGRKFTGDIDYSTISSGGRYSGDSYIWDIATVKLEKNTSYDLSVFSLSDLIALNPAHPKLVVYVDPIEQKGESILRILLFSLITILALIIIGTIFIARLYKKHRDSKSPKI